MATSLDHIFHYYVANVSDRQRRLSNAIAGQDWMFDMQSGTLSFGPLQLSIQLLGTESHSSNTWLWSWANTESGIPESLTGHARALRDYGTEHGIEEFTRPQLSLDGLDGHLLSVAATGVMNADAYYRGPYEGGALFMLVTDAQVSGPATDITQLPMRFGEAVSNYPIPRHRDALLGYALTLGMATDQPDESTVLVRGTDGSCTATFDDKGRLTEIKTNLG